MKKKWSILLTANLLSALVSPLMVHAVTPTTESQEILKNMSQTSQTYANESIEQSDMIKQTLKNIQQTYDTSTTTSEATSEIESDTTTDTTLTEGVKSDEDSSSNEDTVKSQSRQRVQRNENKLEARSTKALVTGKWGTVPWEFDESTGVLTFTGAGNLGMNTTSPWSHNKKISAYSVKKIIFTEVVKAPKDSSSLFSGTESETTEDVLGFCEEIAGIGKLDTSSVTNMSSMFYRMQSLKSLDLSKWDVSKVSNMDSMFEEALHPTKNNPVVTLDISSFNISYTKPSTSLFMFRSGVNRIILGKEFQLNYWANENHIDQNFPTGTWYNEETKEEKGFSDKFLKWYAKQPTPGVYTKYNPVDYPQEEILKWGTVPYKFDEGTGVLTFTDSGTLDEAAQSPWNRPDDKVINATKIKKIVFTKPVNAPENSKDLFSSSGTGKDYLSNVTSIEHLDYLNTSKVTSMDSFFSGLSSIKTLDLSKFDTRNVTTMHGMFYINKSISSLNLNYSLFDTNKVSKMSDMFNGMSTLTNLDISNFKTKTVQDFGGMFKDVSSLTNLNLSQFDTSSATDMSKMFNGMKNLKVLNVSSFNTSNVTSMNSMFNGDSSLTDLSVKNFDTKNVTNMTSLFQGVKSLKSIDVSNFNTGKVTSMQEMFKGMSNISSLNLGSFDFTNVTNKTDMFLDDTLKEITLPKTFSDPDNESGLKDVPIDDIYNGNWVNINDKSKKLGQTKEFLKNTAGKAGTYVWGNTIDDFLKWGDVPYKFDEASGILTFYEYGNNELGTYDKSPWNRTDNNGENRIDATKIKKIVFTKPVKAPPYSKGLFSNVAPKDPLLTNLESIEHLDYLDTSSVTNMDSFFSGLHSIKELDLSKFDTRNVKDMNGMFYKTRSIKSLNLDYQFFDTSKVTKMSDMFQGMLSLTELNMPKLNTSSVKTFQAMFKDVSNLAHLNLSQFNTSSATNMSSMFQGMSKLQTVNISNFNTRNVTNMSSMFNGTSSLTELNVKNFDTRNVTNMSSLFYQNKSLKEIDVTGFDTSKVTNMFAMFFGMENLKKLDVKNFNTQFVGNMAYMFGNVSTVTELDVTKFNTSKVTEMGAMFGGMTGISSLNLSSFDFTNVTDKSNMFAEDKLKEITLPVTFSDPKNTTNLNDVSTTGVYNGQWQNSEGKLFGQTDKFLANYNGEKDAGTYRWGKYLTWGEVPYEFNESTGILTFYKNGNNVLAEFDQSPWNRTDGNQIDAKKIKEIVFTEEVNAPENSYALFSDPTKSRNKLTNLEWIKGIEKLDTSKTVDMRHMFDGMSSLKELDLSHFMTGKVTKMNGMFLNVSSLQKLILSNFVTDNVEDTSNMFNGMSSLKELDLSSFDTSKVTNMTSMFQKMTRLEKLNISSFDTRNVTNMSSMFDDIRNLDTLDISSFNTQNVTNMSQMFNNVQGTKEIIFNKEIFTTSKVTNMSYMFNNMYKLENLDVSNFDTSKVTSMERMFRENRLLERIDVSKFNTFKVTNMASMFEGMNNLSSLNLGSFDFTKVSSKEKMFGNDSKQDPIQQITLPTTFSDPDNKTQLTTVPTTDGYNGNWVNIDNKNVNLGQTPDFLKNTAGKAGTYIWGRQSALHLVKVPDLYDFGNKNSIKDITQILKPQSTGKQEVEIRDDREQKDVWSLSVQASKLESDKLDDLDQARYLFSITSATDANVPIQGITYSDKKVVLPADNSTHVLYSMTDKNQSPTSYNTWIDDMSLIVSQNSGKPNEHYSGTITWSLDSTPQN